MSELPFQTSTRVDKVPRSRRWEVKKSTVDRFQTNAIRLMFGVVPTTVVIKNIDKIYAVLKAIF